MEQSMVNIGNVNENWKRWVLGWLVVVVVVAATSDFGFLATLTGTAGLIFAFFGIQALWRMSSSKSVERTDVGSLDGRREAVQVVGRAQPDGDPLTSPLTDADCVAYQVEVKEYKPSSSGTAGP